MVAARLRDWIGRGHRRRVGIVLGATAAVVVLVMVGLKLLDDPSIEGFRLRATTMVPVDLNLATDVACPGVGSPSPIDFNPAGALANELSVYAGEVIAVQVRIDPYVTELPDQVAFSALWPTDAVTESGPICAFVETTNDPAPPALEWQRSGAASADFVVTAPGRDRPTTIEIWLEAVEPQNGAIMGTGLEVPEPRDEYVVDAVGGRINVKRRPGSPASVSLTSSVDDVRPSDVVQLTATVTNEADEMRSFDVNLSLEASVDGTLFESSDAGCGMVLEDFGCDVGGLMPGEHVEIPITMHVPSFPPVTVGCGDQGRSIGVCVMAEVVSDVSSSRPPATRTSYLMLRRTGSSTGELSIVADPPTVVRRPGESAVAHLLVTSESEGDVTSIEVVGSDCDRIERTQSGDDNGDAFLTPAEIWAFDCTLGPETPALFRVDIAGTDATGRRVVGSYEGVIEVTSPSLEFEFIDAGDGATLVRATNVGRGSLHELTLRLPGCENQLPVSTDQLREGEQLEVQCASGEIIERLVVAFGVDLSGRPFAIRNGDQS